MLPPADPASLAAFIHRLLDNGWWPIPLAHGAKEPLKGKTWKRPFQAAEFGKLAERHGRLGVGIRLDGLVAIDIDVDDPAEADRLQVLATAIISKTPFIRVGHEPRRILLYRLAAEAKIETWRHHGVVDCLTGPGAYVVAFNEHPMTGKPYRWVGEGGSPLDQCISHLPVATAASIESFRAAIGAAPAGSTTAFAPPSPLAAETGRRGRVVDGRDGKLRDSVCAEMGRIKQLGRPFIRDEIVDAVWIRFQQEAHLGRPKGNGLGLWTIRDVEKKVDYALRPARLAFAPSQAKGFWTFPRKLAFKRAVDADRRLKAADQDVAWAMIEAVRDERGLSFLSSTTLAQQTGLHETTVRASRRKLINLGYFVEVRRGGQNRSTRCRPNEVLVQGVTSPNPTSFYPVLEAFSAPPAANDLQPLQTIAKTRENGAFVASDATVILTTKGGSYLASGQGTLFPTMADPLEFGRWVRQQRLQLGLSQRDLGIQLGCGRAHIANIERNHDRLGDWALRRLLELIGAAA